MVDRPQLGRAAAVGGIWTSLQALLNKGITAGVMIVVACFLSPEEFGVANTALGALAALSVLPPLAMGDVLVAHQRSLPRIAYAGDAIALGAGVAMSALVAAATPIVVARFPETSTGLMVALLLILATRPLLEAVAVSPLAFLRSGLRYRTIAVIDGTVQFGASVMTVVMAVLGAGSFSLVVPQVVALGARGLGYRNRAPRIARKVSGGRALRILLFPFLFGASAQYVHNVLVTIEVLALAAFSGSIQVGLYAFAFTLASQANVMIAFQLGSVLQPIFGKIGSDPLRQGTALMRTLRVLGAVIVPLSVVQAAVAPTVFSSIFPEQWRPCLPVFVALCGLQAVYFGNAPLMAFLKSNRRFRALLAWQCVQLAVSAVVFAVVARSHGATGVAWASAATWAVAVPCMTVVALSRSGISPASVASTFVRPWLVAIPVGLAVAAIGPAAEGWSVFIRLCAVTAAGFGGLLLALVATRWTDPAAWADVRVPLTRIRSLIPRRE